MMYVEIYDSQKDCDQECNYCGIDKDDAQIYLIEYFTEATGKVMCSLCQQCIDLFKSGVLPIGNTLQSSFNTGKSISKLPWNW